ncbi:hypothetical protein [Nocardia sp. NPDC051832]|uniref:hypothetical protein n=1 Tax=Nocardia sp. NPDC051832 TaxID=3155673 RepID=UPI00343ECA4A
MARRYETRNATARRLARPAAGLLPLAIALACTAPAIAAPAPVQPGITTQNEPAAPKPAPVQPGVTDESQNALAGNPPRPDDDLTMQRVRPAPDTSAAPPIDEGLHWPVPVEPVAPIAPPPNMLRIGDFTSTVPAEVPRELLDGVNTAAAEAEAFVATQGRSVGINPSRSDKIAAATAAGALGGAALAGIPMAVVGGVGGGVIGAGIGAGIGFAVGVGGTAAATAIISGAAALPTAGAGAIPTIVGGFVAGWPIAAASTGAGALIGGAIGAAAGAAALGIPSAAVGGVLGGLAAAGYAATAM